MPALTIYPALIDGLLATVKAVWPEVKKIHVGWPMLPPKAYPYAVIALPEEDPMVTQGSGLGVFQNLEFMITARFPLPSPGEGIQRTQVEKANLLIAALEEAFFYPAGLVADALVTDPWGKIGPLPSPMTDENKNQFYEVNVLFTCKRRELHTSHQ